MIYLYYGEEKYELYKQVERIKKSFEKLEIGVNFYNITKENITELEPLYQAVNFFGGNKLVILKDTNLKFDVSKLISDADKEELIALLKNQDKKQSAK